MSKKEILGKQDNIKVSSYLPKRVREKFNFKEGDILVFEEEKWQINHSQKHRVLNTITTFIFMTGWLFWFLFWFVFRLFE